MSCLAFQDRKLRSWKRCVKSQISLEAGASQDQVRSDLEARLYKPQNPDVDISTEHNTDSRLERHVSCVRNRNRKDKRFMLKCQNPQRFPLSPPISRGFPEKVSFCSASPVYWTSSFTAVCEPTQSPPDTPSASSHWRLPVRSGTLRNVTGVSINGARLLGGAGNRFPHRVII